MEDCIFCKIIAGEIPSTKVWEDDNFFAFFFDFHFNRKFSYESSFWTCYSHFVVFCNFYSYSFRNCNRKSSDS